MGYGYLFPVPSNNFRSYQFHNYYFKKDLSLNKMKKWAQPFLLILWM